MKTFLNRVWADGLMIHEAEVHRLELGLKNVVDHILVDLGADVRNFGPVGL
jgi:hypothetical protein